ncbi:MAG: acyltransferase family protein [Bacteroidia bacterium]|nr:acyltransferase family protein [Bacteroidia bacterium]
MTLPADKEQWADNMRAMATIAVIVLHIAAAPVLYPYDKISNFDWSVGNIYDSSVRFCVPVFLMLTGALLLPGTNSIGEFFKKRFLRIVYPFLFWSFIYILYDFFLKWQYHESLTPSIGVTYILSQLKGGASSHFWYIYMIIGIYLIFPVISKWIANSTRKEISYYVAVWVVAILLNLSFFNRYKPNIDLIYFSGYLGYPILGYLLSTASFHPKIKSYSIVFFLTGTLITIIGTHIHTQKDGVFYDWYYSYLSPNVLIASVGFFLFFRQTTFNSPFIVRFFQIISNYSYGIYLCHVLVLLGLAKFGISWDKMNSLIGIPVIALVCLSISLAITYLISKMPAGRKVSGY